MFSRRERIQRIQWHTRRRVERRIAIDPRTHLLRLLVLARHQDRRDRRFCRDDKHEEQIDANVDLIDRAHLDTNGDQTDELPGERDDGEDEESKGEDAREGVDSSDDCGCRRGEYDDAAGDEGELKRDEVGACLDEGVREAAKLCTTSASTGLYSISTLHDAFGWVRCRCNLCLPETMPLKMFLSTDGPSST